MGWLGLKLVEFRLTWGDGGGRATARRCRSGSGRCGPISRSDWSIASNAFCPSGQSFCRQQRRPRFASTDESQRGFLFLSFVSSLFFFVYFFFWLSVPLRFAFFLWFSLVGFFFLHAPRGHFGTLKKKKKRNTTATTGQKKKNQTKTKTKAKRIGTAPDDSLRLSLSLRAPRRRGAGVGVIYDAGDVSSWGRRTLATVGEFWRPLATFGRAPFFVVAFSETLSCSIPICLTMRPSYWCCPNLVVFYLPILMECRSQRWRPMATIGLWDFYLVLLSFFQVLT